jgi:G:T/U-mismatch repair DNA glycosylase
MSELVKHKFLNHKINPETETLIIGTFNPDAKSNESTHFFYSSGRNNLWVLLPEAFGEASLKNVGKDEKLKFLQRRKIDFIDIISAVQIERGKGGVRDDRYIDNKVLNWREDLIPEIDKLPHLQRVGFTRKTFSGIPNIKQYIEEIARTLKKSRSIELKYLVSPARFYNKKKQDVWTDFLHS